MTRLFEVGEKRLISEVVAPLFNSSRDPRGVGDDCAVIEVPPGHDLVTSTDRVPADLTAFRAGVLDYRGLGDYLGRLNLSDLAACGAEPLGLLFNAGLPSSMSCRAFEDVCFGLRDAAARAGCGVVGGDISLSGELSLSATSFGAVRKARSIHRSGARVGDSVIATRPLGLTPAAFATVVSDDPVLPLSEPDEALLRLQFTGLEPMLYTGAALSSAGATSLMDNTDGLGQTLHELALASGKSFVLDQSLLRPPELVRRVAAAAGVDVVQFALGAGADFSLVGTIPSGCLAKLPPEVFSIGHVEEGAGVWLARGPRREPLEAQGWNYFTPAVTRERAATAA